MKQFYPQISVLLSELVLHSRILEDLDENLHIRDGLLLNKIQSQDMNEFWEKIVKPKDYNKGIHKGET